MQRIEMAVLVSIDGLLMPIIITLALR